MEADEFESNNNQNENDPEPEKVHSIAETLLSLSNIRAHLMSLGEDTEAFDSLKKLESIFIKKTIEESQSKQADITKFFPVNSINISLFIIMMTNPVAQDYQICKNMDQCQDIKCLSFMQLQIRQ